MLNWRCPHCHTPQPEAARCWVCRRSSTTCETCAHFRRSIAGRFGGTCGLRVLSGPLRGDERRGCWRAADTVGRGLLPVADAVVPSIAAPGGLWADPEV